MPTREKTYYVVSLAIKHLGQGAMVESARLSLQDALAMLYAEDLGRAYQRAQKSLAYSVGMFHPDYEKVA